MQFLYKIPGYILLLFGGFCLSWGGFIVRSFEEATVWEMLFLRSFFFLLALTVFLISIYKKKKTNVLGVMEVEKENISKINFVDIFMI